jgi:hypothetical protein
MSYERPDWCKHNDCSPIHWLKTAGGGECVGKLDEPKGHVGGFNDLSRCNQTNGLGDPRVSTYFYNKEDFILDVFLSGKALKFMGWGIPKNIIKSLPVN